MEILFHPKKIGLFLRVFEVLITFRIGYNANEIYRNSLLI